MPFIVSVHLHIVLVRDVNVVRHPQHCLMLHVRNVSAALYYVIFVDAVAVLQYYHLLL